jgi:hypothetical protein
MIGSCRGSQGLGRLIKDDFRVRPIMTLFHIYRLFVTTRAILLILVWPLLVNSASPAPNVTEFESRSAFSMPARTVDVVQSIFPGDRSRVIPVPSDCSDHRGGEKLLPESETWNEATRICIDHRRSRSPGTVRHLSR